MRELTENEIMHISGGNGDAQDVLLVGTATVVFAVTLYIFPPAAIGIVAMAVIIANHG